MTSNAVVVCTWGEDRDGLPAGAEEVLTLGRALCGSLGVELGWLVVGPMAPAVPELAGRYAVAGLDHIGDAKLESFSPEDPEHAVELLSGLVGHRHRVITGVALVDSGSLAAEILSVHVASSLSGTLNSARLGSASSPVPVRLVDSGTGSFGVSCCLWEAAESVRRGAGLEEAAEIAESTATTVGNVFVVQALDLARKGGRVDLATDESEGVPVVTAKGADISVVGMAADLDEAVTIMSDFATGWGEDLRVAVGVADAQAAVMSEAMADCPNMPSAAALVDAARRRSSASP